MRRSTAIKLASAFLFVFVIWLSRSWIAEQVFSTWDVTDVEMQQGLPDDPAVIQPISSSEETRKQGFPEINTFLQLMAYSTRREVVDEKLAEIEKKWKPGNAALLVECLRFTQSPLAQKRIVQLLQKKMPEVFDADWRNHQALQSAIWNQSVLLHPQHVEFKAENYSKIDPSFREYFDDNPKTVIRWDEILWGGVKRDGIPPLNNPKTLTASEAEYLDDSNIVFGVFVNGEARAYPKRILAWHEMVKDVVGEKSINGVYCTLCGSMIVYDTKFKGKHYELGTSGFLYRSNKLMYDHATKSMWSTIKGEPVVGPLVGKRIKLKPLDVVTTTWGEWKARHPETRVLSLATGHRRDYGEGVAYHNYFATDRLMFNVPKKDTRLKNKAEILAVRIGAAGDEKLAIDVGFLLDNPVYHDVIGEQRFVVITDVSGANRVYDAGEHSFISVNDAGQLLDADDRIWQISERELTQIDRDTRLERLPAHRAFWFGWYSIYPNTRLVK